MYDCIIIGSGPAGISAALTLKANNKNFIIIGSKNLSEKISKAELIKNYPGLSDITGKDFQKALKDQLEDMKIEIIEDRVSGVYATSKSFNVLVDSGNMYESEKVILATGVETVKSIDGEETFMGRGVSYCATCDGFLYRGKTIAILCTSKRYEHEIEYLSSLAKKVYLIPLYKGMEVEKDNIEKIVKMPERIEGKSRVEKLIFKDREVDIDCIFMLKDSVSPAVLVGGLEMVDGHVKVNRDMSTNIKGLYAAGDCTGRPYQYAKATGEGNVAAHFVCASNKDE